MLPRALLVLANEARVAVGRASPISRGDAVAARPEPQSSSPAMPPRALAWAALGPQPGRERLERLGQPRAAVGIIGPAQHPFPGGHRRPRLPADSLSHGESQGFNSPNPAR
jgi:hypothetical protein